MNTQQLRQKINELPPHPQGHAFWQNHCKQLRWELLNKDPEDFMFFESIKQTMFVDQAEYTFDEYNEMTSNICMTSLNDNDIFSSQRQHSHPTTTGNTIHHRYHLYQFEDLANKRLSNFSSIVELGGGYGNMARLAYKLGFQGRYNIIDLPEFALLQDYYLSHHDITAQHSPYTECDLFIATWSLSEIPLEQRKPYEHINAKNFLIAFGQTYADINNIAWFSEFANNHSDHNWAVYEHPYLKNNNYYMIGSNGREQ